MARMRMIETRNGFPPCGFRFRLSSILIFLFVASLLFVSQGVVFGVAQGLRGRGASYAISGVITPAAGGSGATVSLAGVASATTTADGSGNYSFGGLANGRYAITPSNGGYSFNPASQLVTINGADVTDVNFTATAVHPTYTISGTISPASAGAGATMTLSGAASLTTIADASGSYSFSGLSSGSYTIIPAKHKATFNPANQAVNIKDADVTGVNFTVMTRGSE